MVAAPLVGIVALVAAAQRWAGTRGLHSFQLQLNLSSSVHRVTQFYSCMCPGVAQVEL